MNNFSYLNELIVPGLIILAQIFAVIVLFKNDLKMTLRCLENDLQRKVFSDSLLYKNGLRIPMDETDCLRLQTDKNAGKKSTAAVSAYNACMAQGIWPKSFNVEGVLEGLDPVGTYQKMEGINWERDPTGKTVVSDPEKFFKSGGLNYMTSDEIKELFPAFFGYENIGSYRVP